MQGESHAILGTVLYTSSAIGGCTVQHDRMRFWVVQYSTIACDSGLCITVRSHAIPSGVTVHGGSHAMLGTVLYCTERIASARGAVLQCIQGESHAILGAIQYTYSAIRMRLGDVPFCIGRSHAIRGTVLYRAIACDLRMYRTLQDDAMRLWVVQYSTIACDCGLCSYSAIACDCGLCSTVRSHAIPSGVTVHCGSHAMLGTVLYCTGRIASA